MWTDYTVFLAEFNPLFRLLKGRLMVLLQQLRYLGIVALTDQIQKYLLTYVLFIEVECVECLS